MAGSKKRQEPQQQEEEKDTRTYYLKLSTIEKIERMAKEEGRKYSTIIDRLVEAA